MKMTRGKILAAVAILCVLIAAFVFGGSGGKDAAPVDAADKMPAAAAVVNPEQNASPENAEENGSNPEEGAADADDEDRTEPAKDEAKQPQEKPGGSPAEQPEAEGGEPAEKPEENGQQKPDPVPEKKLTCSLKISCAAIRNNMDKLTSGKESLVPSDGVILNVSGVEFSEGETVFDVLKRELQNRGIHMEFAYTPVYNSAYIEGIHNLYEFDCGELSGWM